MPAAATDGVKRRPILGGIFALLLLAGAVSALLIPRSSQLSELVRDDVKAPPVWRVINGKIIEGKQAVPNFVVTVSPVQGGPERMLFSLDMSGRAIQQPDITDTEFRFFTETGATRDRSKPGTIAGEDFQRSSGYSGVPLRLRARKEDNFLAPEKPSVLPAGVKRVTKPGTIGSRDIRTMLYRVPLNGSPAQNKGIELSGVYGEPHWGKGAVFFYRAPKGGYTEVTLPNGDSYKEYPTEASLFARPLADSPERIIAAGLPSTWRLALFPDSVGVGVRALRPYPQPPYDLLRISIAGNKPIRVTDFQGDSPPVSYQDRLWWLEFERVLDAPQSVVQKLVSCREDGSDPQAVILEKDADDIPINCQELAVCEGDLYLLYTRADEVALQAGEPRVKIIYPYVVRLRPNEADLLGKSAQLPLKSSRFLPERCDGGFYYYFMQESRRDTLDFLKPETTERQVVVFRRIRLPE